MRSNTLLLGVLLLVNGVFDVEADEVLSVSVMEGDSVTLHTDDTEVTRDRMIKWNFGYETIAKMNGADATPSTYDGPGAIFKDRLKLDKQTGSLTITNIRSEHIGRYSVDIIRSTFAKLKIFQVTVHGVFSADGVKKMSERNGDTVTLQTRITDITGDDVIEWTFGPQKTSVLKTDRENGRIIYNEHDVRFANRLQLDIKTGDLKISNFKTDVAGVYHIKIIKRTYAIEKSFSVTVSAHLPIPVIFIYTLQSSLSSERSSRIFLCSVVNVSNVTLSWYKGNSLLSSISVSDLSISLSLPLEVEYQDKNIYSCVVNNPIRNQTRHLTNTELYWLGSDSVHCCGTAEAVMRLVISALVGMAAVAAIVVLVYDIKSRTEEKKTNIKLRHRSDKI